MNKSKSFLLLAAMSCGLTLSLASCGSDIIENNHTLTVKVKADNYVTADGEKTVRGNWGKGDAVGAYLSTNHQPTSLAGVLASIDEGEETTLTGVVHGDFQAGDEVSLLFPARSAQSYTLDYTGQNGTLASVAERFSYASATVKLPSAIAGQIVVQDRVNFAFMQALVKLTLIDSDGQPVCPTRLTIAGNANDALVQKTTGTSNQYGSLEINIDQSGTPTNVVYAAVRQNPQQGAGTFTLTAKAGANTYTASLADIKFTPGLFLNTEVTMTLVGK